MLKKIYQRYLIKRYFGKYFDKKSIDRILSYTSERKKPEERECGYIFFDIKQDEDFESTLTNLLENTFDLKNTETDIYGSIVIFYFYKKNMDKENNYNIKYLLNQFIENIPENILKKIRSIYGIDNAKIGLFGSTLKFTHMVLLDDYYKKLLEIASIQYGEIKEIK